jgi:hypothetical protein
MKRSILLLLQLSAILIINYSCGNNQIKQNIIPVIDNIDKSYLLTLSDYAVSIEYISLETTEKTLLTGGEQIMFDNYHFIVFAAECYVFNREGDFIRKIGNTGRGPNEYSSARSGYFFPGDTLLFFNDPSNQGLISYSINGDFIKNCIFNQNFLMVRNINNNLFAGYRAFRHGNTDWNTLIFNCMGDTVSYIPNNYRFEGTSNITFTDEVVMYYFNNELHIKEIYSDTIYSFNNKGLLIPKYILELGILGVPQDIRNWDLERFRNSLGKDFFLPMPPFPVYKQLDSMDCGPTCLRMIAKYYGKSYSLQFLRSRSYITKSGVSMLGISDAAESIGFRTRGYRLTWEQLRDEVPLPCIVHWRQRHFVVVYAIKKPVNFTFPFGRVNRDCQKSGRER